MKFETKNSLHSWSEQRPILEIDDSFLIPLLEGLASKQICELGPGSGKRAETLLRYFPDSEYRAFEPSPSFRKQCASALAGFAERAHVEGKNLATPFPNESRSADLVLILDLIEFLRMDELYMVLSEARRILRPGGICVMRSLGSGVTSLEKFLARTRTVFTEYAPGIFHGSRPLELTHYISPEDWTIVSVTDAPEGWMRRKTLICRRIE